MSVSQRYVVTFGIIVVTVLFVELGLLALSFGGYEAMSSSPPSGDRQHPSDRLDRTSTITFTPSFTTYLPMVSRRDYVRDAYYVSNQGNDDNDGRTRETAFRTIGRALETIQPGGTILILPGTYHEALTLENAGSSNEPITIRGEGGMAVLDGQETLYIGFWCENCSNFVFENLEIRDYTDIGIGVYLSSKITMRNLKVHHNGFDAQLVGWEIEGYGIQVDESQKITVENNDVYQNGPQPQVPGRLMGTGINTYMCTDCVIRNNRSYENIGGGILVEDSINVLVESNEVISNDLDASAEEWWDGGIVGSTRSDFITRFTRNT